MSLSDLFGSAEATNDVGVRFQLEMAKDAEIRAAELAARRQNAINQINAIYDGGTAKTVSPNYPRWYTQNVGSIGDGISSWMAGGTPQDPTEYAGIGDDFYDAYRQSILGYYRPQLNENYRNASGQTALGFSRQGTRRSSAAEEAQKGLRKNYDLQYANMAQSADTETANLRDNILGEKNALLNLARSAEDPTFAVNQALGEVNAVQTRAPNLTPLGDLFQAAAIGYNSYSKAKDRQAFNSGYQPSGTSSFTGAGRTYGG